MNVGDSVLSQFILVLLKLKGNHVLIEVLLELLVGIVDAQLFEAVFLETLEAKNVKETKSKNRLCVRIAVNSIHFLLDVSVNFANDPAKQSAVDGLCGGISARDRCVLLERSRDQFLAELAYLGFQGALKTGFVVQLEKLGSSSDRGQGVISDMGTFIILVNTVINVAHVEDCDNELPHLIDLFLRNA